MDRRPNGIQLLNFCDTGHVCNSLLEILTRDYPDRVASQDACLISESDNDLFAKFDYSDCSIVTLIIGKRELPQIAAVIQKLKSRSPLTEILVVSDECTDRELFDLVKFGASDFMVPPISVPNTLSLISRLDDKTERGLDTTQSLKARVGMRLLVGQSPSFLAQTRQLPLLASCDGRVLILGETGTGKEVFARCIHYLSPRMNHPFVPVSCGAIPVDLLENEMFGHAKGAFTGAVTSELGLIREAEGGTLFLDEVDCLPLLAQTKLLRFLQEGEYKPLGSSKAHYADVRIIAASNINLEQAVKEGRLRQDLYYRLNIARLHLPPLRERGDDIPLLAHHFLAKYAHQFERTVKGFSDAAIGKLMLHDWPGNVRELENTIERAVMLSESESLGETDILLPANPEGEVVESFQESKSRMIAQFERSYLQRLMATYHGNVTQAARAARKNRRAFWELIRKHNIDLSSFRASKTATEG